MLMTSQGPMPEPKSGKLPNSVVIVDREFASQHIEGLDLGTKLWVVARSPTAVLIWVFGHSWSVNGHQRYAEPHLMILPDRSPRFIYKPTYQRLEASWTRLTAAKLLDFTAPICAAFGLDGWSGIVHAVANKKTCIIEGGGGQLKPPDLWGHAFDDWRKRNPDHGFIVLPPGMTRHESYRHKLGWKP